MKKSSEFRVPNLTKQAFAQTNQQTVAHRLTILQEMMPDVARIGEICC